MRISIIIAYLIALLWLPITGAHAQYRTQNLTRVAASGAPLKLNFAASVNPDCSSMGQPTIRLIQAPQHGTVRIVQTRDFATFRASNIRSICNRRRVAGASAHYVSRRGFLGTDAVVIDVIYSTGGLLRLNYTIDVR